MGFGLEVRRPGGETEPMIEVSQVTLLMRIYGLGFVAVFLVFALLYRHAYGRRAELGLDELEALITRQSIHGHLVTVAVGFLSIVITLIGGQRYVAWAGWTYGLIGPGQGIFWSIMGARQRKLKERLAMKAAENPVL